MKRAAVWVVVLVMGGCAGSQSRAPGWKPRTESDWLIGRWDIDGLTRATINRSAEGWSVLVGKPGEESRATWVKVDGGHIRFQDSSGKATYTYSLSLTSDRRSLVGTEMVRGVDSGTQSRHVTLTRVQ